MTIYAMDDATMEIETVEVPHLDVPEYVTPEHHALLRRTESGETGAEDARVVLALLRDLHECTTGAHYYGKRIRAQLTGGNIREAIRLAEMLEDLS